MLMASMRRQEIASVRMRGSERAGGRERGKRERRGGSASVDWLHLRRWAVFAWMRGKERAGERGREGGEGEERGEGGKGREEQAASMQTDSVRGRSADA
jgi:hypothetical protein